MRSIPIIPTEKVIRTFNKFVLKGNPDECWLWTGVKNTRGYGKIYDTESYLVHRVAFVLENGPFDWELDVCHSCDNPPCCNPNHLFLGTALDNMRDRDGKGRRASPIGEKNGRSKITREEVDRIRLLAYLGVTYEHIMEEYGICRNSVGMIVRHETWKS